MLHRFLSTHDGTHIFQHILTMYHNHYFSCLYLHNRGVYSSNSPSLPPTPFWGGGGIFQKFWNSLPQDSFFLINHNKIWGRFSIRGGNFSNILKNIHPCCIINYFNYCYTALLLPIHSWNVKKIFLFAVYYLLLAFSLINNWFIRYSDSVIVLILIKHIGW